MSARRTLPTLGAAILAVGGMLLLLTVFDSSPPVSAGPAATIRCVERGGACSAPCQFCYSTIQDAVDAASSGDEILVATGVYSDVHARGGMNQVVYISTTVTIRGGYAATDWVSVDPYGNPTTLDAQGQGRVVYVAGHVSPTLEALRITGGNQFLIGDGGGVHVLTASLTINACRIYSNTANYGGGLFASAAEITLLGTEILSNAAMSEGGVGLVRSSAELINNIVADNYRMGFPCAGGVGIISSTATLIHNTFARNQGLGASAVYIEGDGPDASVVTLINNIVVSHAIGVMVSSGSTATLQATLWGEGAWANGVDWDGAGQVVIGAPNVWGEPDFLNADARDYRIGVASAAVDRGLTTDVTTDIYGTVRVGAPDIGAHEYGTRLYLPLVMRLAEG